MKTILLRAGYFGMGLQGRDRIQNWIFDFRLKIDCLHLL